MRTRIIFELATILLFLLGTSVQGLFFSYPKNALMDFFQSLHKKKEVKKPPQNIHHYHLHYYPVHTQILTKPAKAPDRFELDKLHSNHLESLGWSESEFKHIPEPEIYRPGPVPDAWPDSSLTRPWAWEDAPENLNESVEQPMIAAKPGIIVQVPLHQNIIVQQPAPKEEIQEANPLASFFQKLRRIKNSIFSHQEESSEREYWEDRHSYNDQLSAYVVYAPPEKGRKL